MENIDKSIRRQEKIIERFQERLKQLKEKKEKLDKNK